ncbi:MAG: glycosyl hydrolase [Ornithinibacter sp.]
MSAVRKAGLPGPARALVLGLTVALALAGCTRAASDRGSTGEDRGPGGTTDGLVDAREPVFDTARLREDASALVQRTPKPLVADRLAEGLVPPTNRWFSGLALGESPQPVFPLPLSVSATGSGFGFGVPQVTTADKTISGAAVSDLTVTVAGATSAVVVAYDDLTVTLEHRTSEGDALGRTRLVRGSPFLTFTADRSVRLRQSSPPSGDPAVVTAGDRTYGAVVDGRPVSGADVELAEGGSVTWYAVPDGGSAATMAGLAAPVIGGTVAYGVSDDSATTRLDLTRAGGAEGAGAVVVLPHQQVGLAEGTTCDLGTFDTVYGTAEVCRGSTVAWDVPLHPVTTDLDLSGLTDEERDRLARQVRADVAATEPFPADTYFGGKSLQRLTQLHRLAGQLGLQEVAASSKATLVEELDRWTEPQGCAERPASCFVHDPAGRGVVGLTASFGSDEWNDHHFHYGYFLYAAGVLAAEDRSLLERWRPVLDLVAADIAGSGTGGLFPDRRTFDPYAAQSWASGTAPFADGNNQESTSEAVNAWLGVTLWARATDNAPLEQQSRWMLAGEQSTALRYGLDLDRDDPVYDGFGHEIVSLTWGGKRDYATWFSPAPAAMLGIILLPASPSTPSYLGGDPERIRATVDEATDGKGYAQQFGDYLLMYSALAGPQDREAALLAADDLDEEWVDDGNSRAYLLAWVMSRPAS